MANESSSILNKLAEMFFKGIDGILDAAFQYQSDMGVLKAITDIPVKSTDTDKEYTFRVELAPVDGQDGVFSATVSCEDLTDFDNMGIESKLVKLNNSNKASFNRLIDEVLQKNSLVRTDIDDNDLDEEDDSDEEELDDFSSKELECVDESKGKENATDVTLTISLKRSGDAYKMNIETSKPVAQGFQTKTVRDKDDLNKYLEDFMDTNVLVKKSDRFEASSNIHFSLNKITSSEGVAIDLTAINASAISAPNALSVIQTLADDDAFVEMIPEGTSSFIATVADDGEVDLEDTDEAPNPVEGLYRIFETVVQGYANITQLCIHTSALDTWTDQVASSLTGSRQQFDGMILAVSDFIHKEGGECPDMLSVQPTEFSTEGIETRAQVAECAANILKAVQQTIELYECNVPEIYTEKWSYLKADLDRTIDVLTSPLTK